jgi:hypothetical protein
MLEALVSVHTKGDPMIPLWWTTKSLRNLEKGLVRKGSGLANSMTTLMLGENS